MKERKPDAHKESMSSELKSPTTEKVWRNCLLGSIKFVWKGELSFWVKRTLLPGLGI